VINPPAKQKRNYWINQKISKSPDTWLKAAEQKPGSWWNDWFAWLAKHSGEQRPAATEMGSAEYPPTEDAPGRYVRVKG
jgi:polyhydroxyalkanoate synthase